MADFFAVDHGEVFQPFSTSHVAVLILLVLVNCLVYRARNALNRNQSAEKALRFAMAALLLLLEFGLMAWQKVQGIWSVQGSLPLQLCDVSLFLAVAVLWSKSPQIYEVGYFLGVGGAVQALLTPDTAYAFPHFVFIDFFLAHSLIVTAFLWMTFVQGMRPRFLSVGKAMFWTNVYALAVGLFNYLSGSNYAYLCAKPANPSLLDYLGGWPWYILTLEFVALAVYLVCYLPFAGRRSSGKSWPGVT